MELFGKSKRPWRAPDNFFDAFDDSHGCLVRRRVWTTTDLEPIPALAKWSGLQTVIAMETMRTAHTYAAVTHDRLRSFKSQRVSLPPKPGVIS